MTRKEYLEKVHKAYCEGRIDADDYDSAMKLMKELVEDEEYKIERVKDEYQAVRLDGYTNTWSAFEKLITDCNTYYIFENDVWGDETCYVVAHQESLRPICDTYDDIETALKDEEII